MQETLHEHQTVILIGGRPVCNTCFADDIELMGSNNNNLQDQTTPSEYGAEVNIEKFMIVVNSRNNIIAKIAKNGELLLKKCHVGSNFFPKMAHAQQQSPSESPRR